MIGELPPFSLLRRFGHSGRAALYLTQMNTDDLISFLFAQRNKQSHGGIPKSMHATVGVYTPYACYGRGIYLSCLLR